MSVRSRWFVFGVFLALGLSEGFVALPAFGEAQSGPGALVLREPIFIDGDAGFTTANGVTGGRGLPQDPYIIEGWEINASAGDGIVIQNTRAAFTIRDIAVHSGLFKPEYPQGNGIVMTNVQNARLENATLTDNDVAIQIRDSSEVVIRQSRIGGGNWGVYFLRTSGVVVSENDLRGVLLSAIQAVDSEAAIAANRISSVETGIDLIDARGTVTSNEVSLSYFGVNVLGTQTDVVVRGNNLSRNQYGMRVWDQTSASVHHNNFLHNRVQAIDQRLFVDQWDDGYPSGGNYWTDYAGVDACSGPFQDVCPDPDGVGDTPYVIDFDSRDFYPLMAPFAVANRAPILGPIGFAPLVVVPGQDALLAASVEDPDGDPLSVLWDFGDGTSVGGTSGPSGTVEAIHAFEAVGSYTVTLTVDDLRGGRSEATTSFAIPEPGLLRVRTEVDRDPARGVPGTIIVDGIARNRWGLTWLKIAPGVHDISFSDVSG
ncbi:MAG: right-handed parallel beta-helix repeat-containing protein, partial [Methanobacteriota archaeon]